jgi:hypothetical protein
VLDVFGKETGSTFHDNYIYMGTYTWGAKGMLFDRNTYTHDYYYGLDPHDDSDFLRITGDGIQADVRPERCGEQVGGRADRRRASCAGTVSLHP